MADFVSQGDVIKSTHITTLQSNYKTVENAVTFPTEYTTTFTANTDRLKAVQINELRTAINGLEERFSGNCNCTDCWECDCCQSCQSCQETTCQECQSSKCQSCQGSSS